MITEFISRYRFRVFLFGSFATSVLSWMAPTRRMPIDVHAVLWWSIPFASLWLVMLLIAAFLFEKKALWILIGAPLALYWPIWLALNGIPQLLRQ